MKPHALRILSSRDWELLRDNLQVKAFAKGAVVISEGRHVRALYFLRRGAARVEQSQNGRGIALALLGPGEMFGEMSFVEGSPASASIIAEDDLEIEVIEGDALESLMAAEAGFAVRFYHSVAAAIAERLAATSRRLTQIGAREVLRGETIKAPRTGNISARQVPADLSVRLDAFESEILKIKQELRTRRLREGEAAARVGAACEGLVATLKLFTASAPISDMGWSDLLAFRDPAQLVAGIGDLVFRETFSTMMSSATMSRLYFKPRGFPDDYETSLKIHENEPEGDDWLGPFIDRWFLQRPLCRSRRASRDLFRKWILQALSSVDGTETPHVVSLACGAALELFDVLRDPLGSAVRATCWDLDTEALLALLARAETAGLRDRVTAVQGDVVPGGVDLAAVPAQVVHALGLGEYLDDEKFIGVLNNGFGSLATKGCLILTNLSPTNDDRELMEHILDWKVNFRTSDEIRALFARSQFAGRQVECLADEAGATIFARCVKS